LDGSVRLDNVDDAYTAAAALPSSVTALSGMFFGRMWDPMRTASTYQALMAVLHAPRARGDTFDPGSRSGTGQLSTGGTPFPWRWVVEVNGGAGVVRAAEALPGVEPCTLGFRYNGGATAGSRLLELWRNGAVVASVTGASLPASLDLSLPPPPPP